MSACVPVPRFVTGAVTLLLLVLTAALSSQVIAEDAIPPRLRIGLNLLPSVVAANVSLRERQPQQKHFTVVLVYQHDSLLALKAERTLAMRNRIGSFELRTAIRKASNLAETDIDPFHAVFMIERLEDQRQQLIEYTQAQQVLLFSPFRDDVARGVAAGFEVTNKVLPAINNTALKAAGIKLKSFFKRIAVHHD